MKLTRRSCISSRCGPSRTPGRKRMVPPNSNRLVPVLVACVLGALVFVVFQSRERSLPPSKPLTAIPVAPPDADTPADTIKTLTANVAAMTADLAALRQDNASLKQENGSLLGSQSQIEQHLKERLDPQHRQQQWFRARLCRREL